MVSVSWKGMRPPFEIVAICAAARDWILDGDLQLQLYPSSRLFLIALWSVSLDDFQDVFRLFGWFPRWLPLLDPGSIDVCFVCFFAHKEKKV